MMVWLVGVEALRNEGGGFPKNNPVSQGAVALHLTGYLIIVAGVAIWSQLVARRATTGNFRRMFRRLNQGLFVARCLIPTWMALDVIRGGAWTRLVLMHFGNRLQLPAMIVGIAPAMIAWVALW
jgi:hypothetical protein